MHNFFKRKIMNCLTVKLQNVTNKSIVIELKIAKAIEVVGQKHLRDKKFNKSIVKFQRRLISIVVLRKPTIKQKMLLRSLTYYDII